MPIRPPKQLFRVDVVDVAQVEREIPVEPVIQYRDREVIREVEKVVLKEDPRLLERLNRTLKENGELKSALSKTSQPNDAAKEKIIEKIVEVKSVVRNIKFELAIAASSFVAGGGLCYLMFK